jgi:hypothetical protein
MLMDERLFQERMLQAYHELAPEAGAAGDFLIRRLAKAMYDNGARVQIGIEPPLEKRTIHQSLDPDQRIVWVCKLWNQTMRYRSRAAIGRHISEVLTPDSFATFLEEWWPRLIAEGEVGPFEAVLVTADGQHLPAKGKSERMRDSTGMFVRTFARLIVQVPRGLNDSLARAAVGTFAMLHITDPVQLGGLIL